LLDARQWNAGNLYTGQESPVVKAGVADSERGREDGNRDDREHESEARAAPWKAA
jgi:hypothetical protein